MLTRQIGNRRINEEQWIMGEWDEWIVHRMQGW